MHKKILGEIIFLIILTSLLSSMNALSAPYESCQEYSLKIDTLKPDNKFRQFEAENKGDRNHDASTTPLLIDRIEKQIEPVNPRNIPQPLSSNPVYSTLAPFAINGNEEFISKADAEGWPGDGSVNNPYIMEGYNITDNTTNLIVISSTTLHFIIRHNIFDGINCSFQGIQLLYTRNVQIEENIFRQTDTAISLNESEFNKITGNDINSLHPLGGGLYIKGKYGIYLGNSSSNNELFGNSMFEIGNEGIKINNQSNFNTIEGNVMHAVDFTGISFDNVSGNTIQKNLIYNTSTAIYLNNITDCVISSNVCMNTSQHIFMTGTSYQNIISENFFLNCSGYAIYLGLSGSNNVIISNTFNNSRLATDPDYPLIAYTHMSDNGANNAIEYNYWGHTGASGHYHDWLSPDSDGDGIVDVPYPINGTANNEDPYPKTTPDRLLSLRTIIIDENSDFFRLNCSGAGTAVEPFIFENYYFFCYFTNMIEVHNISAYFIIQNNYLDGLNGRTTGILFKNVTHGKIDENTVYNSNTGIKLVQSYNNTISNNTISQMWSQGIEFEDSDNNSCTHNYINLNDIGILLNESKDNNITLNTLIENNRAGISVEGNSNNIYTNIIQGSGIGIELAPTTTLNKIVENSIFYSDSYSIVVNTSLSSNITRNKLFWCNGDGILVYKSENTIIKLNEFKNVISADIHLLECDLPNSIEFNLLNSPNIGIKIENSSWALVSNNSISNSLTVGILLTEDSTTNTIKGNEIILSNTAIKAESTSDNLIKDNSLAECINGIVLYETKNTALRKNNLDRCDTSIALKTDSRNNTIANNLISDSARYSIHFDFSHNNSIINNTVIRSLFYGIFFFYSDNNTMVQNIFSKIARYAIIVNLESNGTIIKSNDFVRNNIGGISQAYDDGNSTVLHNFWDDWTRPDANLDGYVDNPYLLAGISGTTDPSPKAKCYHMTPPNITSPLPGEVIDGNLTISWTPAIDVSGHDLTYDVEYSSDEGRSWKTLVSRLTSTNYTFDSSTIENNYYLIRIVAECFVGFVVFESLESPVRFFNHRLNLPELLHPDSETRCLWGYERLRWKEVTDPFNHSIWYSVACSRDHGTTWLPIVENYTNTEFLWDTTQVSDNATYILKVSANCTEGLSQAFLSEVFMIHNGLEAPNVITPTNGAKINGTVPIQWEPSNDSLNLPAKYDIYYSMANGSAWNLLVSDIATEEGDAVLEYEWNTLIYEDGQWYRLKVAAKTSDGVTAETTIVGLAIMNDIYITKITSEENSIGYVLSILLIAIISLMRISKRARVSKPLSDIS
jgi:parallel beta-helix repeat protein